MNPQRAPAGTTDATRLEHAVDALLAERPTAGDAELRPLLEAAAQVRAALPVIPPGTAFEERVARRLDERAASQARSHVWSGLRSHPRLLVAGAVGSAAVSVAGVTAFAVWRASHSGRGPRS